MAIQNRVFYGAKTPGTGLYLINIDQYSSRVFFCREELFVAPSSIEGPASKKG